MFSLILVSGCFRLVREKPVESYLYGEWFVGIRDANGNIEELGVLEVSDRTYSYQPAAGSESPNWLVERFSFIKNQTGSVSWEYEAISDKPLQDVPDISTVAKVRFIDQAERFLVRIDKAEKQLYFHAEVSEFQLYEIKKDFD